MISSKPQSGRNNVTGRYCGSADSPHVEYAAEMLTSLALEIDGS